MKLARRERLFLISGGVFIGIFILITGVIMPLVKSRATLEESLRQKDAHLGQVYTLAEKIRSLQKVAQRDVQNKYKDLTLFGFFEQLALELGIKEHIEHMKPLEASRDSIHESIEVKIKGIGLNDLVHLLYRIDSSPYPVKIRRLNLRRISTDKSLDITFQVALYGQ